MFETTVLASPRDLLDIGLDQALDQVQDTGATTISLNLVAPPACYLRCPTGHQPAIVRADGGFRFPTDSEAFRSLNLQPRGSGFGRVSLAELGSQCRQRGLQVRVRITTTRLPRLASRYPHVAARNVLGDVAPTRLCPAHLDLQHLLKATLLDLRERLAPVTLELADLTLNASDANLELGCGESITGLLSICFCDACRQRSAGAGVDVPSVEAWFRDRIAQSLAEPAPDAARIADQLADAPEVRAYLDVQQACLDAAATDLANLGVPLAFVIAAPPAIAPVGLRSVGPSPRVVLAAPADTEEATAAWLRDRFGPDLQVSLEIPAREAHLAPQALVHRVKQATETHFTGVGIDHFGTLTPLAMTAVRQGFRFARRQG